MLGQHCFDRTAQQRCEMPGHRRNDQYLWIVAGIDDRVVTPKMQQVPERFFQGHPFNNRHGLAHDLGFVDVELGFAIAACRVDEHLERRSGRLCRVPVRERVHRILQRVLPHDRGGPHRAHRGVSHLVGMVEHGPSSLEFIQSPT